jgi:hypothetical protein
MRTVSGQTRENALAEGVGDGVAGGVGSKPVVSQDTVGSTTVGSTTNLLVAALAV